MRLLDGNARGLVFGLQGFDLRAHGIFAAARCGVAESGNVLLDGGLLGNTGFDLAREILEVRIELRGFGAQRSDAVAMASESRFDLRRLRFGLRDFRGELIDARIDLRGLLAVKGDTIFGAVEFERGLIEKILKLAQLVFEFVIAGVEALLLGLELANRSALGIFGGNHFAEDCFQPLGFRFEVARLAGEDGAHQAAHFFAQFSVAAGFRGLAFQGSELFFDFDENVVDAGEIYF